MIKIIWALIGLNAIALLVFVVAWLYMNSGKHVDYQEKGWTAILVIAGVILILLAALPLRFGHSKGALVSAGFFAVLPLVTTLCIVASNYFPAVGKHKTIEAGSKG